MELKINKTRAFASGDATRGSCCAMKSTGLDIVLYLPSYVSITVICLSLWVGIRTFTTRGSGVRQRLQILFFNSRGRSLNVVLRGHCFTHSANVSLRAWPDSDNVIFIMLVFRDSDALCRCVIKLSAVTAFRESDTFSRSFMIAMMI